LTADLVHSCAFSLNVFDRGKALYFSSFVLDLTLFLNGQCGVLSHQKVVLFAFSHSQINEGITLLIIGLSE